MKDVIDVMAMQRDKPRVLVDYLSAAGHSKAIHYIFECGIKLNAQPVTVASAAALFHKFFKEVDKTYYDCYVIGSSCLYLAGKLCDDPLRLRDVVNVTRNVLHRGSGPLELGEEYWSHRSSLVTGELLILRTLAFKPDLPNPHKYLVHYLRSLQGWFGEEEWHAAPIAKTAMAFLQDFYHSPAILDYRPAHIALACLCLTLHCLGVVLPLTNSLDDDSGWYTVFTKDLSKEKNWEIMEKVMQVYSTDQELM